VGQFDVKYSTNSISIISPDQIAVSDWSPNKVDIYRPDGQHQAQLNLSRGCEPRQVAKSGRMLLVGDGFSNVVHVFNQKGSFVKSINPNMSVRCIASVDKVLWVCESVINVKHVHKIMLDDRYTMVGERLVLLKGGGMDARNMAANKDRLAICYVTHVAMYNHHGDSMYQYGSSKPRHGAGELNNPTDVAIGETNHLYVCDKDNQRIVILDPHGRCISLILIYDKAWYVDVMRDMMAVQVGGKRVEMYKLTWK
jgi:hypothetical protein